MARPLQVAAGLPRHVIAIGHEEGWSEVWSLLGRWLQGARFDHANMANTWDDLHPASPTRQLISLQLSGQSDYLVKGSRRRGVSNGVQPALRLAGGAPGSASLEKPCRANVLIAEGEESEA